MYKCHQKLYKKFIQVKWLTQLENAFSKYMMISFFLSVVKSYVNSIKQNLNDEEYDFLKIFNYRLFEGNFID